MFLQTKLLVNSIAPVWETFARFGCTPCLLEKLEERVVNIRDIVDYNITDNYYTFKVDGDRTFLMVDPNQGFLRRRF